jgi:hypothetical protein
MNIQDTGVRGYLKWLQHDQPGIYKLVAAHIVQQAPEAFSDYEQSRAMGVLMGLGDDAGITTTFDATDVFGNPPTTVATPAATNAPDVANAANAGSSSPSVTSIISGLVGAAGQIFLAKSQVDTLNQVNQIQLQRAQMGLAPLNTSSLSLGIPQVNVGLSSGTLTGGGIALAVVAGLGLLFALGRGGGGRRPARA